jgi:hypothetical protein
MREPEEKADAFIDLGGAGMRVRTLATRIGWLLAVSLALPAIATQYYVDGSDCVITTNGSISGTAQAGGDSTHIILASDAATSNGVYENCGILILSGSRRGECRKATAGYVGSTKRLEFGAALSSGTYDTVTYRLVKGSNNNTGLAATAGGTTTGPFGTINKAAQTAIGGTHTVSVAFATYEGMDPNYLKLVVFDDANANVTFTGVASGGLYPLLSDSVSGNAAISIEGSSTGTITLNGFRINSNNPTSTIINTVATDLRLINCDIRNDASGGFGLVIQGSSSSSTDLYMEGGSLTSKAYLSRIASDVGSVGFLGVTTRPMLQTTIGMSIPLSGNVRAVDIATLDFDYIDFDESIAASTTGFLQDGTAVGGTALNGYGTRLRFSHCTGSVGKLLTSPGNWRSVQVRDNDLEFTYHHAILLGKETDGGDATVNTSAFESIVVARNTFRWTHASANHNFFAGVGASHVRMYDNTFITPSSSSAGNLVFKSDDNVIARNTIYCNMATDAALYIPGGKNNDVIGNTIVAEDTSALTIDTNQDGTNATDNCIAGNILKGSTAYLIDPGADDADANTWNNFFEGNVLWASGTNVIGLGGANVTLASGISGVQTAWATYVSTAADKLSDAASVVADPRFVNPAAYDFRVRGSSPANALGAGANSGSGTSAPQRMGMGL